MENNTAAVESVKAISTRFFKWNQRLITNKANRILPFVGLFVLHLKLITLQSTKLVSSIDFYKAFVFDPLVFFEYQEDSEAYFTIEVAPSLTFLSSQTLDIIKKDIFGYMFGCFVVDPNILQLQRRRLPVVVTDVYLTRQMDENVDHVGKRQKLSYISSFEDIVAAVFEHVCIKFSVRFLWGNTQTRNLGLLRVCPLVKEKKSRYTTDDPSCTICLDGYNKGELVLEGPCNHRFHKACLMEWLPRSCPMCRTSCAKELLRI